MSRNVIAGWDGGSNHKGHKEHKREQWVPRGVVLFMPVLGATIAEYVECLECKTRYSMGILRSELPGEVRQIIDSLTEKLKSGSSIEEMEATLLSKGLDLSSVKRYVGVAAGITHKRCARCNCRYRPEVNRCGKCGSSLK